MIDKKRRKLMLGLTGLVALSSSSTLSALVATPRQTAGPFYPDILPLDDDNNLTEVAGKTGRAKGLISDLSGRIVDINGHPLQGMRIEIWQCDANGRYRHARENGSRSMDENFQGHGLTVTNAQGLYRFRTIRPVRYPGRTPHIHVAVFPAGERPFVTQLYVKEESGNDSDFLYTNIPSDKRHLVTADFSQADCSATALQAKFDIVLNRTDGAS